MKLLECVNPVKGRWRLRWDVQEAEGGCSYMEEEYDHRPSLDEVRACIVGWENRRTAEAILSGMAWEGSVVWLSSENQFNYKSAYDLARQTDGANLPYTVKLGSDEAPVYRTFETVEGLGAFYRAVAEHIQTSIEEGWARKDRIDWSQYLE